MLLTLQVHTWPAKKPCSLVLPPRYCSSCFGFSASTLSTIFSISTGSTICHFQSHKHVLTVLSFAFSWIKTSFMYFHPCMINQLMVQGDGLKIVIRAKLLLKSQNGFIEINQNPSTSFIPRHTKFLIV